MTTVHAFHQLYYISAALQALRSYKTRMASRKTIRRDVILFVTFQLLIRHGSAVDKYHINIPVFFNTDDIYQEFVFNSAVKMFGARSSKLATNQSWNDFEVEMHFSKPDFKNLSSRANGLGSLIPKISNLTSSSQGAIFVDVIEESVVYSTFLESVSIPSIGLFRSQKGFPVTKVWWEISRICCSCIKFTIWFDFFFFYGSLRGHLTGSRTYQKWFSGKYQIRGGMRDLIYTGIAEW